MKYQTVEQLSEMKLNSMKLEYQRQMELPSSMEQPFDERFGSIVNQQYTARKEAKIKRLIKAAALRESFACLEHLDYDPVRNLKKTSIAELSDCEWIRKGSNLIVCGPTGVGKTYLVSAFGREACMKGLAVKSFRVTRLLTDLSIGRGDGSYNKLMQDLVKPDLLILDEAIGPPTHSRFTGGNRRSISSPKISCHFSSATRKGMDIYFCRPYDC